jgi:hypothetical protein
MHPLRVSLLEEPWSLVFAQRLGDDHVTPVVVAEVAHQIPERRPLRAATTSTPIWISGTVASHPFSDWDGPRFLIDSRRRRGQIRISVNAYAPERRGLAAQYQLLGVYSGRIDESADIGSAWPVADLVGSLREHGVVPRFDGAHTRHGDVLLR